MSSEIPEPWAAAMRKQRFTKPDGSPNASALARAADVHTSTITSMVHGRRAPDAETIRAVALALRVDVLDVYSWAGLARTEARPFEPHPDADLLTVEERSAVNELIRLLALPKKRGEVHDRDTTPTIPVNLMVIRETPVPIEDSADQRAAAARRPRRLSRADEQRTAQDQDADHPDAHPDDSDH